MSHAEIIPRRQISILNLCTVYVCESTFERNQLIRKSINSLNGKSQTFFAELNIRKPQVRIHVYVHRVIR